MKKKYQRVREGVRKILLWDEEKNRWKEPKKGKFEAHKTVIVSGEASRIYRTCRTMGEVKEFLENTVEDQPLAKGMLFKELVSAWKKAAGPHMLSSSRDTIYCKLRHAEAFFNDWEVTRIDANAIDQWLAHLKTPAYLETQHSTRLRYNEEYQALRYPLSYYQSRKDRSYPLPFLREHTKMLKVKDRAPSPKKDLELEQVTAFLQALRQDVAGAGEDECYYYVAALQYSEAARIQEIAALDVEDIDLNTGELRRNKRLIWGRHELKVRTIQPGLKARDELVSFSQHSLSLVKEWLLKSGRRSGLLFSIGGRPLSYRGIKYRYDKALFKTGLPFRGTHILRHAAGCEHYETGKDHLATKEKMGHSSITMTERYAKSRPEAQNKIQQLMDEKLNNAHHVGNVGMSGNSVDLEVEKQAN